ncbi:AMP-binding protein [Aldersonia sp. NBC_00410]|jgi:non-ribosomal peptide synthetase component F|uniref:AMP-binding protein n=1 Tax=Aldersonia sp. NBC_00410 TaxID=2975954 RepID=UPI00225714BF|nr:AMP-binding protein [Aldersonia sp. NBC_00410]MCX5042223.1 AMP-binding protein [Aldersonia sp. NBC_00410]
MDGQDTTRDASRTQQTDRRANQLARMLVGYGVGPGSTVVTALRSIEDTRLAQSAVVRAGAHSVAVDPGLPGWRISAVVADARADLGITLGAFLTPLPPSVRWLELDDPGLQREAAVQPAEPLTENDRIQHPWLPAQARELTDERVRRSPEQASPAPR